MSAGDLVRPIVPRARGAGGREWVDLVGSDGPDLWFDRTVLAKGKPPPPVLLEAFLPR